MDYVGIFLTLFIMTGAFMILYFNPKKREEMSSKFIKMIKTKEGDIVMVVYNRLPDRVKAIGSEQVAHIVECVIAEIITYTERLFLVKKDKAN